MVYRPAGVDGFAPETHQALEPMDRAGAKSTPASLTPTPEGSLLVWLLGRCGTLGSYTTFCMRQKWRSSLAGRQRDDWADLEVSMACEGGVYSISLATIGGELVGQCLPAAVEQEDQEVRKYETDTMMVVILCDGNDEEG